MATLAASTADTSAERRFFTGMALVALAILATVLVGFARSFFLRPLFPGWPVPALGLTDLLIVALAIRDFRTRGRLHRVTLWGRLLTVASQPLRFAVSNTDSWLAFARWATGLLG